MYKKYRKLNPKIDNKNWQILFNTQFQNMQSLGAIATLWINGLSKLGFNNSRRPTVAEINQVSSKYTGYRFVQTKQNIIMPQIDWYKMVARYEMPITNFVRKPKELEYCDEPDSFHEIMGHVVFLLDKEYSDMYQLLANTYVIAFMKKNTDALRKLDFIGGYLIELSLIREKTGLKAFGSTFYSSNEVAQAYKPKNQIQFTEEALDKESEAYDRSAFQGKYYIIKSVKQIVSVIEKIKMTL